VKRLESLDCGALWKVVATTKVRGRFIDSESSASWEDKRKDLASEAFAFDERKDWIDALYASVSARCGPTVGAGVGTGKSAHAARY